MQLHTNDLSMNDGKEFRQQLVDNFKNTEIAINAEIKDRRTGDNNLNEKIDQLNQRCKKLEEDVSSLTQAKQDHEERLKRIESVLFGATLINQTDKISRADHQHSGYKISDINVVDDEAGTINPVNRMNEKIIN